MEVADLQWAMEYYGNIVNALKQNLEAILDYHEGIFVKSNTDIF